MSAFLGGVIIDYLIIFNSLWKYFKQDIEHNK